MTWYTYNAEYFVPHKDYYFFTMTVETHQYLMIMGHIHNAVHCDKNINKNFC